MTPERWQQVSDLLDQALRLSAAERSVYLAEFDVSDPELRREVESLLSSHEAAGVEFLITPAMQTVLDEREPAPRDTMLGRRLGAYQIVERLGEGGMGEVYRAFRADDQYRKQVALKVVRGGHDSGFVIRRFKNERQILASLDHPNIAHLLDGGTTEEGVPYFVMELIEGESIDQYCDHHELVTNDRLKLFLEVCSAVQFAHQRLIIHRDIKPGNILVTADGVPKLLDFGIAKILDSDAAGEGFERTVTQFQALTPGYASPEQIKGAPITTASDVYSLGVVLYELLTGHSPYRVTSRAAQNVTRAVCELEPEKPSSAVHRVANEDAEECAHPVTPIVIRTVRDGSREKLARQLSGDLDNIVLMSLRKEPQRRYASVEQFATDIRRHLEDLPVIARKDTFRYRTTKFATRNKASLATIAIVVVVLVVALLVTFREAQVARQQAELARQERTRAERRFNDVRTLANSLIFEVHDSIKDLPGATAARKLLVTRALDYLDSLSREAKGDASLQRELAAAYDRVGDVLGDTTAANVGDFDGAAQSYAKALAIRESLAAAYPADLKVQIELADEYWRLTTVQQNSGDFAGALQTAQRSLLFVQKIVAGNNDPALQDRLAGAYWLTARLLEKNGDFPGALQDYRQGAAIREPIATTVEAKLPARTHLVGDYLGIAKMLAQTGHVDEAVPMSAKALNSMKEISEANPNNATLREYMAEAYNISGDLLEEKGDLAGALEDDIEANRIFRELMSVDPSNQLAAESFVFSDLSIGEVLIRQGKTAEGLKNIREALATRAPGNSKSLWDATGLSASYSGLGMAYVALAERAVSASEKIRRWSEARSWYQKGLDVWNEKPNHGPLDGMGRNQAAEIVRQLTKCDANLRELKSRAHLRSQ
jgi:serine/threonine protein kinase/tetratricopeptide (TPR) repeat protein